MKPKKPISFLLGAFLIVSILLAIGSSPAISKAVTTSATLQEQVASLNNQLIQMLMEMIRQLQVQLQQLIAAKTTPTIQCDWCGSSCIDWTGRNRTNTYCPAVMPPAGSYCQNINGACQITNNTTNIPQISTITPSQGYSYTRVTIYGTNLSGATAVKFYNSAGQESSSLGLSTAGNSVSSNSITFTGGLAAEMISSGTYQVKVVTPSGTSNGLSFTFIPQSSTCRLTASFTESIGGAPTNNPLVGGYRFTVVATGGTLPYTYEWSNDGKQNMDSNADWYKADNAAYYNWSIPGEKTVYVIVKDSIGCVTRVSTGVTITTPTTLQCTDTDGGKNYNVRGTISNSTVSMTDTCEADNSGNLTNVLSEYYCDGYTIKNELYTCLSGYHCQDGACKLTPSSLGVVLSGPTNLNVGQSGTYTANVIGGSSAAPYTFEWSADGKLYVGGLQGVYQWNQAGSRIISIKVIDSQRRTATVNFTVTVTGAIPPTIACYDSDNGKNYSTKGRVTGLYCPSSGGCTDPILEDVCESSTLLKEYYCDGTSKLNITYTCPNGCQDGACKAVSPTPTIDLKINGSDGPITVLKNSIITATWTSTGEVSCSTYGTQVPLVRPGIWGVNTDFSPFPSSGIEKMYAKSGFNTTVLDIGIDCGNGLSDHVIVNLSDKTCVDTDGGNDIYQKGTMTVEKTNTQPWEASGPWSYTDSCSLSQTIGLALQEYSCTPSNSTAINGFTVNSIVCPSGYTCWDGACTTIKNQLKSPCGNYGDINSDSYVTKTDLGLMLAMGYPPNYSLNRADVNKDGAIDYFDTEIINKYLVGVINTFPVCNSSCSWCGTDCVLSSTVGGNSYCANVVPPTGSTCSMINGQCTVSGGGAVQGAETHIFEINLGYGMENDEVKELQSVLTAKGYFIGMISGYFGWQTEEAVKAFQLANNLPVTGFAGSLTRELLNS